MMKRCIPAAAATTTTTLLFKLSCWNLAKLEQKRTFWAVQSPDRQAGKSEMEGAGDKKSLPSLSLSLSLSIKNKNVNSKNGKIKMQCKQQQQQQWQPRIWPSIDDPTDRPPANSNTKWNWQKAAKFEQTEHSLTEAAHILHTKKLTKN